jgi:hypothetical protein
VVSVVSISGHAPFYEQALQLAIVLVEANMDKKLMIMHGRNKNILNFI